jgi:hypothetical protein
MFPQGSFHAGALSGSPAGSPSGPKPWRFAARQEEGRNPKPAASQLPGRNPVLPDRSGAEAPFRPVAVRRLASRFCRAGREPEGPRPACSAPTRRSRPLGALRSLPLSHPLKASPQLPHGGGFVSRPAFALRTALPGGTEGPLRSGCDRSFQPLPVDRFGHGSKLSCRPESRQPVSAVDNKDNGNKIGRRVRA